MATSKLVEPVIEEVFEQTVSRVNGKIISSVIVGVGMGIVVGFYVGYRYNKSKIIHNIMDKAELEIDGMREHYDKKILALEANSKIGRASCRERV